MIFRHENLELRKWVSIYYVSYFTYMNKGPFTMFTSYHKSKEHHPFI